MKNKLDSKSRFKPTVKILSILLSILFLIEMIPMSVLSAYAADSDFLGTFFEAEEEKPTVVCEVESERGEYTKHFRLSDGTYKAATYAEPIHRKVNGKWEEIDNTLSKETIDGKVKFTNAKADKNVKLSESITDGVSVSNENGYVISFAPMITDNKKVTGVKKNLERLDSASISKNFEKVDEDRAELAVKNKSSGIKYSDVFENTDIEYTVRSSSLKESIVVNQKQDSYEYNFIANFGKLEPKLESDGSVGLYSKNGEKENLEMKIEAPFMFDDNGEISNNVSMSFVKKGTQYVLTVVADSNWINDESRKFPVIIDPTVKLNVGVNDIIDAYVDNSQPNDHMPGDFVLYVGYNSYGKTRTYIKYNLPDLPDCSIVTGASLALQQYDFDPGNGGTNYVYAYDCGNNSWDSQTITWNNQPMNKTSLSSYTVLDYYKFAPNSSNTCECYNFDITKAAKNWYENGVNNGIMLASSNESASMRTALCSSDCGLSSDYFPTVWVAYVNNTGLEDYWTYKTVDMGRSGTVYVNDYNGAYTYIHDDVSTTGNRMPVTISHVYTRDTTYASGSYGNMKIGVGFRLNIMERVIAISNSGTEAQLYSAGYRAKYLDADGTIHYFKSTSSDSNKYEHEFDSNLTITKQSDGKYLMKDNKGNEKLFSSGSYLLSVTDANSNTMTITYVNYRITKVTDGAGKEITFTYDSSNFLTAITDPTGRSVTFTYTGNSIRDFVYSDGKKTTIWYDTGKFYQITQFDSGALVFQHKAVTSKSKTFYRIASIETRGKVLDSENNRETINKLTYQYKNGETIISDMYGKVNYIYFDNAGRTVNVRDQEGNTEFAKYNSSGNKTNTLAVQSDTYASINNLAKNNSAETTVTEWYQQVEANSAGAATIATDQHFIGQKSFRVESTQTTGRVYYCQDFTATPGETYTLSAYIKLLADMTGGGGAYVGLSYKNASGNWVVARGNYVNKTQDWHRESISLKVPSGATGEVRLMLTVNNGQGAAYFDGVQLEKGKTMNRYNLLNNSGFDYGDTYWGYSYKESSDGVATVSNDKVMRIYGNPSKRKNFYQDVRVDAKAGDTVVFGGYVKAYAAGQSNSDSADTTFKVTLTMTYADGTKGYATQTFYQDVNEEQYVCSTGKLAKDCASIRYYCTYYEDVNNAQFDDACLYIDNFGSSYEYDSDGKLIAATDGTGQGMSYTYNGPDVTKISQNFDGEEKESCTYTYDSNHNILTEKTKGGVVTEYQYTPKTGETTTYGNPTRVIIRNSDYTVKCGCNYEYSADYNYLTKVIDSRNGTTTYSYDNAGRMISMTDPRGNTTTYTYDENTDELLSTSGANITNSYTYSNGALSTITHNGFSYGFNYDSKGNVTSTTVANQALISHTYNANGTLNTSTYGNGDTVSYTYDSIDRVVATNYNGVSTYEADYNREGLLTKSVDRENNVTTVYDYDFARRLSSATSNNNVKSSYTYDERNNVNSVYTKKGSVVLADNDYVYGTDGLPQSTTFPLADNATITYTHDAINRRTSSSLSGASETAAQFNTYYNYITKNSNQTGVLSDITYKLKTAGAESETDLETLSYTYDANGNIKTVSVDGVLQDKYTYDSLGQLFRHDDATAGKSYYYNYDQGGNITRKREYAYTIGTLSNPTSTINYTYDTTWKDKLTSYNGNAITYDEIGNPLTYNGYTFSWQKGRQLATISGNGIDMSFKYNADGLRTEKTNGTSTTQYYYSGTVLLAQYSGGNYLKFLYSADGELIGFMKNNTPYYYIKNQQGDILYIYNNSGSLVSEYRYDAWGKCTVYNPDGTVDTTATSIGNTNPIRYRGYYYDTETNLYYLQSRYYNPEWGRFVNGDSLLDGYFLLGNNMFAYCENNPVIYCDPIGHSAIAIIGVGILVAGMIFGFSSDRHTNNANLAKKNNSNRGYIDPSKPPTPESGYVPPKKDPSPSKVRNPNGSGKGWPANDGGVWMPDNNQDGGPGWTVQYPKNRHEHRYPNGHVRTHNISFSYSNTMSVVIGSSVVVASGIGIVVILLDDATVMGVMDNIALPSLIGTMTKGVEMCAR